MKICKLYRFTAAFVSFLLIVLSALALPVRAEDEGLPDEAPVSTVAETGTEVPAESDGFSPDTIEADLGELVYDDIDSTASRKEFPISNQSGGLLIAKEVSYLTRNDDGTEKYVGVKEETSGLGNYYIPYFIVHIPKYFQTTGSYIIWATIRGSNNCPPVSDVPYTSEVKVRYTDQMETKEYELTIKISVMIIAPETPSSVSKLSAGQVKDSATCDIAITMNKEIVPDISTLTTDDFKIRVVDRSGKEISLGDVVRTEKDTSNHMFRIVYNRIKPGETEEIYDVFVQYKDEEEKQTTIAVEPSTVNINVPSDGNVVIKVVDKETGKPIQGATVRLTSDITGEIEKTTGADGYVKVKVALAQYSLVILKDGYETQKFSEPDLTKKELVAELSLPGDLPAGEKANVQVVVTDQDGKPVEDAIVKFLCPANKDNGTAYTKAEGIATLNLKRNDYEITVSCSGHFSASKTITVNNREEVLKITLERRYICNVTTTVLDENGNPVSGAEVYFTCPTDNDVGKSTTNSQGKTPSYIAIRANDYVLKVSKPGYETYEKNVRVSESSSDFTVTLERPRYDDDDDDDDDSSFNSGSSSSGSSSGSVSIGNSNPSSGTAVNSQNQVVAAEVNRQITQAINSQISAGQKSGAAEVKVKNAGSITASALSSMRQTVLSSKGTAKLLADSTTPDGKLTARLYIDPEKSSGVSTDIQLGVSMETKDIQKTSSTFEKYFDNNVSVVHFDHQGAFGMEIEAAVKVDLSKLNTQNLMFYSYNPATNRYTPITNAKATIDQNGFLHFATNLGGDLVITDKPLAPRS